MHFKLSNPTLLKMTSHLITLCLTKQGDQTVISHAGSCYRAIARLWASQVKWRHFRQMEGLTSGTGLSSQFRVIPVWCVVPCIVVTQEDGGWRQGWRAQSDPVTLAYL